MPFKKGESGNSAGRPTGQTPATALKKIIADNIPDILNTMIEQAKQGDVTAGKALLDKVCPSLKPQALSVNTEQGESLAMAKNLKSRLAALEAASGHQDWLILECYGTPSGEQLQQMKTAHSQKRMAILFGERMSWAWCHGYAEPWLSD